MERRKLLYKLGGAALAVTLAATLSKMDRSQRVDPQSVLSTESDGSEVVDTTPSPESMITPNAMEADTSKNDLLDETWNFIGGEKVENGIIISPIGRLLMEQDGQPATENPPINLSGMYLTNVFGDFEIEADIDLQSSQVATIQLYGRVPIIADEFLVERESVRVDMKNNTMVVSLWNGYTKQKPTIVKTFPLPDSDKKLLSISRLDKTISFSVNGVTVGDIPESGIFASKNIWFGFNAKGGSWLLSGLQDRSLSGGTLQKANAAEYSGPKHVEFGLQKLASLKRPGFLVSVAMALSPVMTDSDYQNVALDNAIVGSLTPENAMKMINLQPQPGVFTFQEADALVSIAKKNGIHHIHGHTLVFGEANPSWFTALPVSTEEEKAEIEMIMRNHIQTVVSHFSTTVSSWDVINEPLPEYDDMDRGQKLRRHKWFLAMGEEYIIKALTTAHEVNPDAMLFINEWGLEEDGERWNLFLSLLTNLKTQLVANNIPLEKIGVGFQAHVYERGDRINPETLRNHIRQLEALGFKSQISEMDVYSDDGDSVQAKQYADIFKVCFEEKSCIRWNAWILSDRYNWWKDDDGTIMQGKDGLYDTSVKPRPAVQSITNYLKN